MNFTLLGQLVYAVEAKIRAAKEKGVDYCFIDIKRHTLDVFKHQIDTKRDEYSKALSSHFGKLGAQARKKKKAARMKLLATLKEVLQLKKIQEAQDFWLQEKLREGSVVVSPEGDLTYLEENEED